MAAALVALALVAGSTAGCGAKSLLEVHPWEEGAGPTPRPEVCNGLDDDLDGLVAAGVLDGGEDARRRDGGGPRGDGGCGVVLIDGSTLDGGAITIPCDLDLRVDEDFRDEIGRYVHDDHCGVCGNACERSDIAHATAVNCAIVAESPACVARACEPGFSPSTTGTECVPIWDRLCLPCADDGDCGDFEGAGCADVGGERRCAIDCALGCPTGYACADGICAPMGGSCSCDPGETFDLACALTDPEGEHCPGSATCADGVLSECAPPPEACDEIDNDCNGVVDDPFRDTRGAYIVDIHHCGECGVDCTLSMVPEGDLVCGGDPFAPSCVLHCPDTDDGIQPGDRVDGDRDIATGCECTVTSLDDVPGPVRTSGPMLDVNCDGADGIVIRSFYVAPDGNDAGPGSPTRPMRTIDAALRRAAESITSDAPRPHVFVAVGLYTETLHLPDGVQLHGGYRRDFLALDPDGFRVEVRAPADTTAPGGAALEARGVGATSTVVEWMSLRGVDADEPGEASFGMYVLDPRGELAFRDLVVRAGVPGSGMPGMAGRAGTAMVTAPAVGQEPRGAVEDGGHQCLTGDPRNVVAGGTGGRNTCGGTDTSGGDGGSPRCPEFASFQPSGQTGRSAGGVSGGSGGAGGQDSEGPVTADTGTCPVDVCCGLADFTVPTDFTGPQPGRPGGDGSNGGSGTACSESFGRFDGDRWTGVVATGGSAGRPGSGGGGGGGGGGAVMNWFFRDCEWPDGLGGGGGGGGAGGCGGEPGTGGTSGAPSVGILIRRTTGALELPQIQRCVIEPADGGRGGDGGAGGDGGRGANGAFGGALERSDRSTPTLSGPFPGARGGQGGNGGAGGGGGGGCGGASVGVWIAGTTSEPPGTAAIRSGNTFRLGRGGLAGRGGGGAAAAPDGAEGGAADVVVR